MEICTAEGAKERINRVIISSLLLVAQEIILRVRLEGRLGVCCRDQSDQDKSMDETCRLF